MATVRTVTIGARSCRVLSRQALVPPLFDPPSKRYKLYIPFRKIDMPTRKTAPPAAVRPTTRARAVAAPARRPSSRRPKAEPAGSRVAPVKPTAVGVDKAVIETAKPRHKLVRDSFTIPKGEYALLGELKTRAAGLARPTKKGELLRAGIAALTRMGDAAFLSALGAVPSLKTGRPKAVGGGAAKPPGENPKKP